MRRFGRRRNRTRCALHLSTASRRTALSLLVLSAPFEPYAATVDSTLHSNTSRGKWEEATVRVWIGRWCRCDAPLGTLHHRPCSHSLDRCRRQARCPPRTGDIRTSQSTHSSRTTRTEQPTVAPERSKMPWPDSTPNCSRERRSSYTDCKPSEPLRIVATLVCPSN